VSWAQVWANPASYSVAVVVSAPDLVGTALRPGELERNVKLSRGQERATAKGR
jgi:hypothetical protein